MIAEYIVMAAVFMAADLLAGYWARSKFRPIASLLLAAAWPITAPLAIAGAGILVGRLRDEIDRGATHQEPEADE